MERRHRDGYWKQGPVDSKTLVKGKYEDKLENYRREATAGVERERGRVRNSPEPTEGDFRMPHEKIEQTDAELYGPMSVMEKVRTIGKTLAAASVGPPQNRRASLHIPREKPGVFGRK